MPLTVSGVRGELGNKCAGQHNLKMIHFKETLAIGIFLVWSSAICVFFAGLFLAQDGGGKLFCSDSGGDPLTRSF
jgi:hypothetical protein